LIVICKGLEENRPRNCWCDSQQMRLRETEQVLLRDEKVLLKTVDITGPFSRPGFYYFL
jgi:hypothetical protein